LISSCSSQISKVKKIKRSGLIDTEDARLKILKIVFGARGIPGVKDEVTSFAKSLFGLIKATWLLISAG
jgi:hypothetical protein